MQSAHAPLSSVALPPTSPCGYVVKTHHAPACDPWPHPAASHGVLSAPNLRQHAHRFVSSLIFCWVIEGPLVRLAELSTRTRWHTAAAASCFASYIVLCPFIRFAPIWQRVHMVDLRALFYPQVAHRVRIRPRARARGRGQPYYR